MYVIHRGKGMCAQTHTQIYIPTLGAHLRPHRSWTKGDRKIQVGASPYIKFFIKLMFLTPPSVVHKFKGFVDI